MEGPRSKRIAIVSSFDFKYVPHSTEPLAVLHEPTGTVTSGGHQWMFVPEGETNVFTVPGPLKFFFKNIIGIDHSYMRPGKIAFEGNGVFAISDKAAFAASCKEVLSWEFDRFLDIHAQVGKSPETGGKALFEEALAPIVAGDWDRVPFPEGTLGS